MILIIDNYDSFVMNLVRYVQLLGEQTYLARNDAITLEQINALNPSHIILSPGPCTPNDAGICLSIVKRFAGVIPILGVCLGHQVIGQCFGAKIVTAHKPMHGKASLINHNQQGLFKGCDNPLSVGRYHSLCVDEATLSSDIDITAYSKERDIMAIAHKQWPVYGVQFHPESVLTPSGKQMIKNFLTRTKESTANTTSHAATV